VADVCAGEVGTGTGWRVFESPGFVRVVYDGTQPPAQGWKLHLSATVASAEKVLERALPVLLDEDAPFKIVSSLETLRDLNCGAAGLSQVGKFVTVYPGDDEQAVRLALALDRATAGLRGPAIPSDRVLRPGSLVHYRYGGFDDRRMQLPFGLVTPAIAAPTGELVPDRRVATYQAPSWAIDPFVAVATSPDPGASQPLVGDRYLIGSTVQRTPRGAVHLAVDIDSPKVCVLKEAYRDAYVDDLGRDARDRLRHERYVLGNLSPDPRFPATFGIIEEGDRMFLALELIEGETLERHVRQALTRGRFVPSSRIVAWGRELAAMLATIHAKGFVYRDLKSPNIIVTDQGRLALVDFELAHEPSSSSRPFGRGTLGYTSPEQETSEPAAVTDDVYSLGAVLYFLATSAEPSRFPRPHALLDRRTEVLNPGIGPELGAVIARCLHRDAAARYQSMDELADSLASIRRAAARPPRFGRAQASGTADTQDHFLDLARRLGDSICRAAQPTQDGGVTWASTHPLGAGTHSHDVNTGSAGTLLALAELVSELGVPSHERVLTDAARTLAFARPVRLSPLPGLYIGDAGVAAALLRSGQVLASGELTEAATRLGRQIGELPYGSPDLFTGTAGRLRFHVWAWDETGDGVNLDHAKRAGEVLTETAQDAGEGALCWSIPSGHGDMSGATYLGYAHGAAGIGDALLDLFDATGEERFLAPAIGAARWLCRSATRVLTDESGLGWPATEGSEPWIGFWCHGSTGIGRFFLHLARAEVLPEAHKIAVAAARAVARAWRGIGPTQCHGLAGSIEMLLDLHQDTGDGAYLTEAQSLATLLETFAVEREDTLVWSSDTPSVVTPDYMVGYAGAAVCLLRLAAPGRLPTQLSRQGFRQSRFSAGPRSLARSH
jgi:Lanthionine synthetase C-like protein/Protein kinase domain